MVGLSRRLWIAPALVLLLIGALALVGGGCGGDADAEETTTTLAAAPAPADPAVGLAVPHQELVGSYLRFTEETPQEVVDAIEAEKPLVVLFYIPGSEDDGRMREAVENLKPDYPDVVFLTYEHTAPDSYGDLAAQLRIDYPPQMTFITRDGMVNKVISGYADEGTVNQGVANIL